MHAHVCVCVCVCFTRTAKNTHLCMDLQSGCTPVGTHPGLLRKRSMLSMGTASMFLDTPLLWRITEEQQLHIYEHACQFQCRSRLGICTPDSMMMVHCLKQCVIKILPSIYLSLSLSHLQLWSSILLKLQAPF
jgi:hypothetical protein